MVADEAGARDLHFMERALFLAGRGRGRTSPNPMVGAVIVSRDGVVVGQGAHERAGEAHAETIALTAAGPRAAGAVLYCTLEPCCHVGRTGPCVDRIVAAGISRVVAAMEDPNPLVAGQGFAFLRAHDVAVSTGAGEADARRLNGPFLTWITRRRPFVVLKAAMSADGFAGRSEARVQLTGAAADRYFHRQRAEVGAIGVGSNTVVIDDPLLTARLVYRERPLTRVVFDWRLRVPPSARLFSTRSSGPVIMVVLRREAESRPRDVEGLRAAGAELEMLDGRDLAEVLRRLADRDVQSLLVEGGPTLQAAFLDANLVDRVQWVRTPVRLGSGILTFAWPRHRAASGPLRETVLGEDVLTECDVHRLD